MISTPPPPKPFEFHSLDSPGTLGPLVHSMRESKDLSRHELAALAGVGARFVYDLERGKPTLRLDKVLAVLAVLGLQALVMESRTADGLATKR